MRIENWNLRFLEKLEELQKQGPLFDWDPAKDNTFHCLTFGSTMVEAITGRNYFQELSPSSEYTTALGAYRVLKGMGFDSVEQLIGSIFEEKDLNYIVRGDLVLIPAELGEVEDEAQKSMATVVAVADPPFFWVVHSVHGLSRGSLTWASKAFSVE